MNISKLYSSVKARIVGLFSRQTADYNELVEPPTKDEGMLELHNNYRASKGLGELEIDYVIVDECLTHCRYMKSVRHITHYGYATRNKRLGGRASESVAIAPNAEKCFQTLVNSPRHKKFIVDPKVKRIGFGNVDNYWTIMYSE